MVLLYGFMLALLLWLHNAALFRRHWIALLMVQILMAAMRRHLVHARRPGYKYVAHTLSGRHLLGVSVQQLGYGLVSAEPLLLLHDDVRRRLMCGARVRRPHGYGGSCLDLNRPMELESRLDWSGRVQQLPATDRYLLVALVENLYKASFWIGFSDFDVANGRWGDGEIVLAVINVILQDGALSLCSHRGSRWRRAAAERGGASRATVQRSRHLAGGGRIRRVDVEALLLAAQQLVVGGNFQIEWDLRRNVGQIINY